MRFTAYALFALFSTFGVALAQSPAPSTLNVYHIGNSVTDTIGYTGLTAMASQRGRNHVWGRDVILGAPLQYHRYNPNKGYHDNPYDKSAQTGGWDMALKNQTWDVVTLQPFDRVLTGTDRSSQNPNGEDYGDFENISYFLNYIAANRPDEQKTQVYIYSRWPRREASARDAQGNETAWKPIDFKKQWVDRSYTGQWDNTMETRDYFERLLTKLRVDGPQLGKQYRMVPVGDVLLEIDQRARAGKIPGLSDINAFYADGIHFNGLGAFAVGTTYYATLYGDNPIGLSVPSSYTQNMAISADMARAIQEAAWSVVSQHPYSGVTVPEPTAGLTVLPLIGFALHRGRRLAD